MLVVVIHWERFGFPVELGTKIRSDVLHHRCDMLYNLLLGRPWIHANWIVPSTLYQCFKYVDDNAMVQTVFAKKKPFKGVENYFIDALLYQKSNKIAKKLLPEDVDSGNEANSEPEEDMPATFAFKSIVDYLNDPECNNPTKDDDEGVLMRVSLLIILSVLICLNLQMIPPYTCPCPS